MNKTLFKNNIIFILKNKIINLINKLIIKLKNI